MFDSFFTRLTKNLIKAFERPELRWYLVLAALCVVVAGVFFELDLSRMVRPEIARPVVTIAGGLGAAIAYVLAMYQSVQEEQAKRRRLQEKTREVESSPEKTKAAWDLAQEKLEMYLQRNLSQVRSIYWLCVVVMGVGFLFIGYGAYTIMQDPNRLQASTLSAVSGVVVSFLGGSFMLIYKATMEQAKEYVTMLERINAVGMSLQILDSLDSTNAPLKNSSKAELARELLKIYAAK